MRGTVLLTLVTAVFANSCSEVSQLQQKEQSLKKQLQRQTLILDRIRLRTEDPGTRERPDPPDPGRQHRDCSEVFLSGFRSSGSYWIRPDQSETEVQVYCDMSGGGGWTVIQRRTDGSQRFNRCSEVSQLQQKEQSLKKQLQRQTLILDRIRLRTEDPGTRERPDPPDPGRQHRDCSEVFLSGFRSSGSYWIRPDQSETEVQVYCDMSGGGGWTVIQRRTDGSQRFNRSWAEYRTGFGDRESAAGETWIGNELLHQLTTQGNYSLRIRLQDFDGQQRYADYRDFRVGHEQDQYRLSFGRYEGTAGDALSGTYQVGAGSWSSHQGAPFSTYDRDNDNYEGNCAQEDQGGWWFNKCHCAHLNGLYFPGGPYSSWSDSGVVWFPWRGWWYSLKSTLMEIRPQTPEGREHPAVDPSAGGGSVLL